MAGGVSFPLLAESKKRKKNGGALALPWSV